MLFLGGSFHTADVAQFSRTHGTDAGIVILTGTLMNAGATLALDASLGTWQMNGGQIIGGTVSTTGGNTLDVTGAGGATLNGVTLAGTVHTLNTTTLTVLGDLTLNGGYIFAGAEGGTSDQVTLRFNGTGSQTLSGMGTLHVQALYPGRPTQIVIGSGAALTVNTNVVLDGPGADVTGPSLNLKGRVTANTAGTINVHPNTWTNQGTLQALNGATLTLGGSWTSTAGGTLSVSGTGSTLNLGGSFATGDVANFSRSGGTVNLTGTLTNTNLTLDAVKGSWLLAGGTVLGGTVTTSGSAALVATTGGGVLNGVTLTGVLNATATASRVTVRGGLLLSGATVNVGGGSALSFDGTQILGGTGGTIAFTDGNAANRLLVAGSGAPTLTIGSNILIDGQTGMLLGPNVTLAGVVAADATSAGTITIQADSMFTSTGTLRSANAGTLAVTNTWSSSGPITVNGGNANLSGTWSNSGRITVTGGTLTLGGNFHTGDVANFNRSGGTVQLTGTLTNTGQTLALDADHGPWTANGGTVIGGTVAMAGNNLTVQSAGLTLNGVTLDGSLGGVVDATVASTTIHVANNLTLTNATLFLGSTGGTPTSAALQFGNALGTHTLGGTGTIELGGSAANQLLRTTGTGAALTVAAGVTVEGTSGTLAAPQLTLQGTVRALGAGGVVTIETDPLTTWTSTGSLEVRSGGRLVLGGHFQTADVDHLTSSGGSTVKLTGTLDNTDPSHNTLALDTPGRGSWVADGGQVLGGTVTTPNGNTLTSQGTGLTLSNVILIGTLNVQSAGVTLNNLTLAGTVDATFVDATVTAINDLTMNAGMVLLGRSDGATSATLQFSSSGTHTLGGTGTVAFGGSAGNQLQTSDTLAVAAGVTVDGRRGTVQGPALTLRGTVRSDFPGGAITVRNTVTNLGSLSVAAGSTLAITALTNFDGTTGTLSGGTYDVAGTLQVTGAAIRTNAAGITLDGPDAAFVDDNGTNALAGLAANLGQLTIQNGALLTLAGDFGNGGSLTLGPDGTLAGDGLWTTTGTFTWTGGTLAGAGMTMIAGGGRMLIGGPDSHTGQGRAVCNAGTVIWEGAGGIWLGGGSYIDNEAGAAFRVEGDADFVAADGTVPVFDNEGVFSKSSVGNGVTTIGAGIDFHNGGTVEVDSGTLAFAGAALDNFDPAGGTLTGGTFVVVGTLQVTGAGNFVTNDKPSGARPPTTVATTSRPPGPRRRVRAGLFQQSLTGRAPLWPVGPLGEPLPAMAGPACCFGGRIFLGTQGVCVTTVPGNG